MIPSPLKNARKSLADGTSLQTSLMSLQRSQTPGWFQDVASWQGKERAGKGRGEEKGPGATGYRLQPHNLEVCTAPESKLLYVRECLPHESGLESQPATQR